MTALSEPLLTAADVAELLTVPRSSVLEYTRADRADRLPCIRIGRHVRFLRTDLETWLQRQRDPGGPQ